MFTLNMFEVIFTCESLFFFFFVIDRQLSYLSSVCRQDWGVGQARLHCNLN